MTSQIPPEHWEEVAELYVRFRDDMVRFAARLLGRAQHLAHDLVQEVFKAAALRWGTLRTRTEDGQRAWLYRVLKNKVFDQWGAAGRAEVGGLSDDLVADLDTPRTAVSHLLLRKCWKIIDSMPRAQRRVALLKWQGEWANDEIARHLGIAESTVRVHLRNARRTLATELGSEVVFPSEWRDESPGGEAEDE
ncbi:sigma-70 family RNA polymerase sigma factor [Streptomyces sp. NPDC004732]|uniref:RNA polymerase sigma factor n=1 Tax=Streptomyces sp. NPDC004732 TaxID=3154290 RepID=UPI0033BB8AB8